MKKFSRFIVVGVVALLAIAGAAVAFAQEDSVVSDNIPAFVQGEARGNGFRGQNGPRDGGLRELAQQVFDKDEMKAVVAEALGITVEELDAAKEAGTRLPDLAEALGVDVEAVQTAVQAYREEAVAQAIADGIITEEQGEQLLSHPGRHGRHGKHGGRLGGLIDRDAVQTAVSDTLGISVDELQAAREAGTTLEELAAENGVDVEDVHAAVEAVKQAAVEQAVADGVITQEQADQILSGEGRFGRRGFGGPRGGGFGGPGNAPAQDADSEA